MSEHFVPTVTAHHREGGELILETLDPDPQSNLVTDPLERVGDTKSEEQKEKLRLWEDN
jgi:hypothetical protein